MTNINPKANYYGFNPPFFGGAAGVLSRQENEKLIKNDILQLLLTLPGERVMMPGFGTQLRAVIFEQLDQVTLDILNVGILGAIGQYEPRIKVESLQIKPDFDRHGVTVRLAFSLYTQPTDIISLDTFISNGDNNG
jgi:phage baseplate assembly protein W